MFQARSFQADPGQNNVGGVCRRACGSCQTRIRNINNSGLLIAHSVRISETIPKEQVWIEFTRWCQTEEATEWLKQFGSIRHHPASRFAQEERLATEEQRDITQAHRQQDPSISKHTRPPHRLCLATDSRNQAMMPSSHQHWPRSSSFAWFSCPSFQQP